MNDWSPPRPGGYVCPYCGHTYNSASAAAWCCNDDDKEHL